MPQLQLCTPSECRRSERSDFVGKLPTGPKSETGLTIFPIATRVRLVRCVFSSERPDRPRNRPQKATVPVVLGKRRRREVSSFREIAHRTEVQNRTYHFPSYDSYLVSSDVSARVGIVFVPPFDYLALFFQRLTTRRKRKKIILPSLPFLYLDPCLLGDLH